MGRSGWESWKKNTLGDDEMRKKGAKIRHTRAASPMLTASYLTPEVAGRDRVAVMAITQGWATLEHLNIILESQQMLLFGGTRTKDQEAVEMSKFGQIAIGNIRDRMKEKGRIGATGDEIKALRAMVDFCDDWWKRQAGSTFSDAYRDVDRLWATMKEAA